MFCTRILALFVDALLLSGIAFILLKTCAGLPFAGFKGSNRLPLLATGLLVPFSLLTLLLLISRNSTLRGSLEPFTPLSLKLLTLALFSLLFV